MVIAIHCLLVLQVLRCNARLFSSQFTCCNVAGLVTFTLELLLSCTCIFLLALLLAYYIILLNLACLLLNTSLLSCKINITTNLLCCC